MKARLVDLIGSSGIENATSAQPKNLACAPRLSPFRSFGGVAGDEMRWKGGAGGLGMELEGWGGRGSWRGGEEGL